MQSVTDVILASEQGGQPVGPAPLSEQERDVVGYFFSRLRLIDPLFFDQVAPDVETERLVKREFANMLRRFSRAQVDAGLAGLKRAMSMRLADFRFLTVPKIIGLVECGGKLPAGDGDFARAGIYREFRRERLLEDEEAKAERLAAGRRGCADLLTILDDGAA